jgi:hypothetical protein
MVTIFVLFKDSKASFLSELDRSAIEYSPVEAFSNSVMASGTLIAIAQTVASSTALAAIVVAWLKARASRKIIVTTEANEVVHLEGYSIADAEKILAIATRVAVIDTSSSNQEEAQPGVSDSA